MIEHRKYTEKNPLCPGFSLSSHGNPSVDGAIDTTESNRDRIIMIVSATIASEITDGINISVVIGSHCEWKRTTVEMQLWNFASSRTLVARWNMTPPFCFRSGYAPSVRRALLLSAWTRPVSVSPRGPAVFLGCLSAFGHHPFPRACVLSALRSLGFLCLVLVLAWSLLLTR